MLLASIQYSALMSASKRRSCTQWVLLIRISQFPALRLHARTVDSVLPQSAYNNRLLRTHTHTHTHTHVEVTEVMYTSCNKWTIIGASKMTSYFAGTLQLSEGQWEQVGKPSHKNDSKKEVGLQTYFEWRLVERMSPIFSIMILQYTY